MSLSVAEAGIVDTFSQYSNLANIKDTSFDYEAALLHFLSPLGAGRGKKMAKHGLCL